MCAGERRCMILMILMSLVVGGLGCAEGPTAPGKTPPPPFHDWR